MKKQKDYTIVALLIPLLIACLFSCNIGLKSTNCPSHDPHWFTGKQKYYKH